MTATALIISGEHLDRLRALSLSLKECKDPDQCVSLADQMADIILAEPYLSHYVQREFVPISFQSIKR